MRSLIDLALLSALISCGVYWGLTPDKYPGKPLLCDLTKLTGLNTREQVLARCGPPWLSNLSADGREELVYSGKTQVWISPNKRLDSWRN